MANTKIFGHLLDELSHGVSGGGRKTHAPDLDPY